MWGLTLTLHTHTHTHTHIHTHTQTEKQKNDLVKELEELKDRIEEAGGVATAQIELNKKREAELLKMQSDAQAQAEDHDRTVADMRKKHQQSVNDLQEQVFTIYISSNKPD